MLGTNLAKVPAVLAFAVSVNDFLYIFPYHSHTQMKKSPSFEAHVLCQGVCGTAHGHVILRDR